MEMSKAACFRTIQYEQEHPPHGGVVKHYPCHAIDTYIQAYWY